MRPPARSTSGRGAEGMVQSRIPCLRSRGVVCKKVRCAPSPSLWLFCPWWLCVSRRGIPGSLSRSRDFGRRLSRLIIPSSTGSRESDSTMPAPTTPTVSPPAAQRKFAARRRTSPVPASSTLGLKVTRSAGVFRRSVSGTADGPDRLAATRPACRDRRGNHAEDQQERGRRHQPHQETRIPLEMTNSSEEEAQGHQDGSDPQRGTRRPERLVDSSPAAQPHDNQKQVQKGAWACARRKSSLQTGSSR